MLLTCRTGLKNRISITYQYIGLGVIGHSFNVVARKMWEGGHLGNMGEQAGSAMSSSSPKTSAGSVTLGCPLSPEHMWSQRGLIALAVVIWRVMSSWFEVLSSTFPEGMAACQTSATTDDSSS